MFSFSGRGKTNDDSYGFSETSLWVVDGTSRIKNYNLTKSKSDAQWFAKHWNDFFQRNLDNSDNFPALISRGVDFINSELNKLGVNTYNKLMLPLISFSIVKFRQNYIDIFTVGDCDVVLKSIDGLHILLTEENNLFQKKKVIDNMRSISKAKRLDLIETRRYVDKLIEYGINNNIFNFFSHCKEDIHKVKMHTFQAKDIATVCILSDGVSRFYNTFNIGTIDDLMYLLDSDKFVQTHDILSDFQSRDVKCNLYPRLTPYNDMTVIYANVQK